MVPSRHNFQTMEIYWFFIVDIWKMCVRLIILHVIRFDHLRSHSGLRKEHTLVRPPLSRSAWWDLHSNAAQQSYKISWLCATLEMRPSHISTSTLGTLISKDAATYCLLSSFSLLPVLILVVTYFPAFILHTTMEFSSPVIAP